MYQLSFSLEEFLTQYWQKKPTIIKGGFANFSDPLSPDELA
jgi:50S ribosomal protein L16 3-hydroxylase